MATVLIVEDEKEMARGLKDLLEFEKYSVVLAPDGKTGLKLYGQSSPDLVLLDRMLPDMDGIDVCRSIRQKNQHIPILMLTARGQEHDVVRGFEAGADDYVAKPFSVAQLLARIRALLRRGKMASGAPQQFRVGDKSVDTDTFVLRDGETEIPLTFYEVEILKLLYAHPNQNVSRESILKLVWGVDADPTNRTVDNFIAKLRKKLEKDQKKPQHLITVYGTGYKLIP